MRRNVLLNCDDESNQLVENPSIELLNNRFLVVSRSGVYFSLYDIVLNKPIFDELTPFNVAMTEGGEYIPWVKKNIDQPIRDYIGTHR